MLVNILMPTYNDEKTIEETLKSIVCQTYDNWHLTIINDGSVDNTEKVIKNFIKKNKLNKKITYIYEENADQLNAIKNGLKSIKDKTGLVYVLHSDDLLDNEDVFKNAVEYFKSNPNTDAIISSYNIIDKKSNLIGYQKVKNYSNKLSDIALMGLWLGRNLYVDVAFWKYEVYEKEVFYNYLTWNTPFWFCHEKNFKVLKIDNVSFSFFKYRISEDNYINNEIGLLNVLNGELRTELLILNKYNIPLYKFQYLMYRIFNKLSFNYHVFYTKKRSKNIYNIIKFIINKRIKDNDLKKYKYYESILFFFKNYSNRTIKINNVKLEDVFLGSDVRLFNKKMLKGKLPKLYNELFKQMNKGFNTIMTDKESYGNLVNVLKYLDIYEYVEIKTK